MANVLSPFSPTILSSLMQDPLHKSLVAEGLCSTKHQSELSVGQTVDITRRNVLAAGVYVDADGVSLTDLAPTKDQLAVDIQTYVGFDVSKKDRIQNKISAATEYADEAVYSLKDDLDKRLITSMVTDAATTIPTGALSDTTIIPTLTAAGIALRTKNVVNNSDWFALLNPLAFGHLQSKLTNIGFNTADAVISNGRVGEALDFKVFVSNNLPTKTILFGKIGATDLVVQSAPTVEEYQRQVGEGGSNAGNTQLGKRFIADLLAGIKTTASGKDMLAKFIYT